MLFPTRALYHDIFVIFAQVNRDITCDTIKLVYDKEASSKIIGKTIKKEF